MKPSLVEFSDAELLTALSNTALVAAHIAEAIESSRQSGNRALQETCQKIRLLADAETKSIMEELHRRGLHPMDEAPDLGIGPN